MITAKNPLYVFNNYVEQVLDGTIVAGAYVRAACKRHVDDIEKSKTGDWPYYFDESAAQNLLLAWPLTFHHTIGSFAAAPFVLEPWQAFIVCSIFSWKHTETNQRRFRSAYVTMGRKNGKSTLAASVAIKLAALDKEEQAQVFIGATKREQANIIFSEVGRQCRSTLSLHNIADQRQYEIRFGESYIKPLGSDRSFDGLSPSGVIFDELHEWKEQHRPFYDTLTTGFAARRQPLRFTITTAGSTRSLLWKEEETFARGVVDGSIKDETTFAFIASIDPDDDPFDESVWVKAMPNLGVSVDPEFIRNEANKAKFSVTKRNAFIRYYMNREVSASEQAISVDDWKRCKGDLTDWADADAIVGAMDAGGRNDLGAIALVARFCNGTSSDGSQLYRYEVKTWAFMDQDTKRDLTQMPFVQFVQKNQLTVTPYTFVAMRDKLTDEAREVGAGLIGFDPFATQGVAEDMMRDGFQVVRIQQSRMNYHDAIDQFLSLIEKQEIKHDGNDLLSWAVTNLVVTADHSGRYMPDRRNSADKIDPVVALLMSLRLLNTIKPKPTGALFVA
jgi:phage terminase large subunit-like protein